MNSTAQISAAPSARFAPPPAHAPVARDPEAIFGLLARHAPVQRRVLRAGDAVLRSGERFERLHVIHSGFFKAINFSEDGREQVVALYFKGDWVGLDGIAEGMHAGDVVAMDTGEVWSIGYQALLDACVGHPPLLAVLHAAMSQEIARDRDLLMSLCSLPADARVAEFLRRWVGALARRGLRTEQITLRLSRAEIGSFLGMTLETVSRALSKLAREEVIGFPEKGRREIEIRDPEALDRAAQRGREPAWH